MAYDPYNDPNRFARQAAQRAAETAQALSRRHQQDALAAAARRNAETQRRFVEDSIKRQRDNQTQLRNDASRRVAGEASDPDMDSAPVRPRRGARLFGLVLVAIIAFAAAKAFGWI